MSQTIAAKTRQTLDADFVKSIASTRWDEAIVKNIREGCEYRILDLAFRCQDKPLNTVRLLGAGAEWFAENDIEESFSNTIYFPPDWLADDFAAGISECKRRQAAGERIWPGQNARLITLNDNAVSDPNSERKRIALTLGPICWFDYISLDRILRSRRSEIESRLDLASALEKCEMDKIQYHNLVDVAVTIITSDCKILYGRRLRVGVSKDKLTSIVAENFKRADDMNGNGQLFRTILFRCATRGIKEELSPMVLEKIRDRTAPLVCTGFGFNLDGLHPDALFLLIWPGTAEELVRIVKARPGVDFYESRITISSIEKGDRAQLLDDIVGTGATWTGGGVASVMRALEIVDTICDNSRCSTSKAISILKEEMLGLSCL